MKRFMKGCGMIALALIAVGVTLGMAGRSVAGQDTIQEVVENVTNGKVRMDVGNWWGWNIALNDRYGHIGTAEFLGAETCVQEDTGIASVEEIRFGEETCVQEGTGIVGVDEIRSGAYEYGWGQVYDIDDTFDFDDDYAVYQGEIERCRLGSNIRNLDIEISGGFLAIEPSEDNNIYLEAMDVYKFQGFVEEDTLCVKAFNPVNGWNNTESLVTLYLPVNAYFHEVEIELGAGDVTFSELNAQEISLEVGAGSIVVERIKAQELDASVGAGWIQLDGMEAGNLDVEVSMGEFYAHGTVSGDVDVECAMGSVDIGLMGSERDFNYYLEGAMGNIWVGDNDYISNTLSQEKTIHNNAAKDMDIECAMGDVTIWFYN